MRIDAGRCSRGSRRTTSRQAVERLGAKPLMLVHARGDEVVPPTNSRSELYELAAEPKRLLMLDGGDHRSAQHDAEIQGETLRWLSSAMLAEPG